MSVPTKRCPQCGETYPRTSEYFHNDRSARDGLRCWCKSCTNVKAAKFREEHPGHNREYFREYHQKNKEKKNKQSAQWQREHPEQAAKRKHEHYLKHAERYKQNAKQWKPADPERFQKQSAARRLRYYYAHQDKARAAAHRRRAAGKIDEQVIKAQYKRQKGRCYYCGEKVGKKYHLDHVVPVSRGGTSDPDNLVIACPHCNDSKNNKLPHEWAKGGRLL